MPIVQLTSLKANFHLGEKSRAKQKAVQISIVYFTRNVSPWKSRNNLFHFARIYSSVKLKFALTNKLIFPFRFPVLQSLRTKWAWYLVNEIYTIISKKWYCFEQYCSIANYVIIVIHVMNPNIKLTTSSSGKVERFWVPLKEQI